MPVEGKRSFDFYVFNFVILHSFSKSAKFFVTFLRNNLQFVDYQIIIINYNTKMKADSLLNLLHSLGVEDEMIRFDNFGG